MRGVALVMLCCLVAAQTCLAAKPIVTSVTAQQQDGTSGVVDIYYDVSDAGGHMQAVSAVVSTNSGAEYNISPTTLSGDVGAGIPTGTHKHITWDAGVDLPLFSGNTVRVNITTDDGISSTGMVLIPAGSFTMGNCMTNIEGDTNELPLHSVSLSAFYMDKYEVTFTEWSNLYLWAIGHGYSFHYVEWQGKSTNHPVNKVTWYDCVKWCNARSEKEGLTPCYYTNAAQTLVYRGGDVDLSNEWVKWSANGYRLPTEAEWEKAARGGTPGHRFAWSGSDYIQHAWANYQSDPSYTYDLSPFLGEYHPTFYDGVMPFTSPVGYFAGNDYGLYDMTGNVYEWCWDWYDASWYSNPGATISDTHGPPNGDAMYPSRVLRGGSWGSGPYCARCAYREYTIPGYTVIVFGFRCVKGL